VLLLAELPAALLPELLSELLARRRTAGWEPVAGRVMGRT
jgi:hypothetical protein